MNGNKSSTIITLLDLHTCLPLHLSGPRPGLCGLRGPLCGVWPQHAAPLAEPKGHLGLPTCPLRWPRNPPAPGRVHVVMSSYQRAERDVNTVEPRFPREQSALCVCINLTSAVGKCGWASLCLSVQNLGPPPPTSPLTRYQPFQVCETLTTEKKKIIEKGWV